MSQFAISYTRFSSGSQRHGTSLERQQELSNAYCKEHNLTLIQSFHDGGKSGFHGRHLAADGELRRLLKMLDNGDIPKGTHLLIEQTDRLSRQPLMQAFSLVTNLLEKGLVIVTLDDKQKYTYEGDQTQVYMLAGRLHRGYDESRSKSERLSKVWANKQKEMEEGIVPKMRLPFWLARDSSGKVIELSSWVSMIEEVLNLAIEGHGGADIAAKLNGEGRLTKDGVDWNSSKITKLIRNKQLIGWHTRKSDKTTYLCLPPIVSQELFSMAQKALDSRTRTRGNSKQWNSALSGLTSCGACGGTLKLHGRPQSRTAVCRTAVDGGSCTNRKSIRYKALILGSVASLNTSLANLMMNQPIKEQPQEKRELEAKLAKAQVKVSNLTLAIAQLESPAALSAITRELDSASNEIEKIKRSLSEIDPVEHPDDKAFRLLWTAREEVPSLVTEVLEGSKAAANKLNTYLHSIDGFKISLQGGVASVLGTDIWFEKKELKIHNEYVGEVSIVKADEATKTSSFVTDSGHEIAIEERGTPLGGGYYLAI